MRQAAVRAFIAVALAVGLGSTATLARAEVPPAVRARFGRPVALGRSRGPIAAMALALIDLLRERYGVDARGVPIYLLDAAQLPLAHRLVARGEGGPEHLRGFELDGVVYVSRDHAELRETLAHELLHALSEPFAREANARGDHALVEGVTQYLTLRTGVGQALRRAGVRRRGTAYGTAVRFADRLADAIGEDVLADCYFRGGYQALERAADRALGRGRFARATRRLRADDLGGALAALGAAPRDPLDRVWLSR